MSSSTTTHTDQNSSAKVRRLAIAVSRRAPLDAVALLTREPHDVVSAVLEQLELTMALRILSCLPAEFTDDLATDFAPQLAEQWQVNTHYPEKSVGRLMERVNETFSTDDKVSDVVTRLRPYAQAQQLSYAYVVDENGKLQGVVAMRELLFATGDDLIRDVMVGEPFYFHAATPQEDAMKAVLQRHYPVYPVCDDAGVMLGVVRGYALFEQQTYELTAQAGRMVGIEKEEHLATAWTKSLRMRHPWLQLNLLTALIAGMVVGLFEDTIQQVVALAAFLPVLAGQSGNTGCQALAVTLRSMTLNELKPGMEGGLVQKETFLGVANGLMVGVTAALVMLGYATFNGSADPLLLAGIVLVAMAGSCTAAGIAGVVIPLALRRLGADPATASTIFLTTATDVVSMGAMLGLAALVLT